MTEFTIAYRNERNYNYILNNIKRRVTYAASRSMTDVAAEGRRLAEQALRGRPMVIRNVTILRKFLSWSKPDNYRDIGAMRSAFGSTEKEKSFTGWIEAELGGTIHEHVRHLAARRSKALSGEMITAARLFKAGKLLDNKNARNPKEVAMFLSSTFLALGSNAPFLLRTKKGEFFVRFSRSKSYVNKKNERVRPSHGDEPSLTFLQTIHGNKGKKQPAIHWCQRSGEKALLQLDNYFQKRFEEAVNKG